ncbi:hypothetical protein ES702_03112 [subsurface metagenome]
MTDEDSFQPVQNVAVSAPVSTAQLEQLPSQQSAAFANLPLLDLHSDFDFVATHETSPDVNFDAWVHNHLPPGIAVSGSAAQHTEIPLPQSNVTHQPPTALTRIQPDWDTRRGSVTSQVAPTTQQPSHFWPSQYFVPTMLPQSSFNSTTPAQQPFRTPSVSRPPTTQLLTPENSPLSVSTTLSQPQRPVGSVRPPPQPQTVNSQASRYLRGCCRMSSSIVWSHPWSLDGSGTEKVVSGLIGVRDARDVNIQGRGRWWMRWPRGLR